RDNLPAEISSFVGREAAIAQVVELVAAHRLVTLSGAPGVGKTRLGLRVASELRETFTDGVWVIELAPLTDPELLPSTIAAVLGARVDGSASAAEALAEHLQQDELLLVLDNCEHLADACAALVAQLLRACPGLGVLTTSREPLGLTGEVCWTVQPLTAPDLPAIVSGAGQGGGPSSAQPAVDALLASEAGRLFVERARAVRPSLTVTEELAPAMARICQQLDGIPLAIELAAARAVALSPPEIAARLGDRLTFLAGDRRTLRPHQRTLRESIDWSHDLLSEPERALFRRLAI